MSETNEEKPVEKISCDTITSTPTETISDLNNYPCDEKLKDPKDAKCAPTTIFTSSTSSSSGMSMGFFNEQCRLYKAKRKEPPNIGYEVNIAKSIMQQYSTISGDNLFDHLSDIIKRVIDERPPNVIDFFEEFSRNVREQKFHLPERFPPDGVFGETRAYRIAKALLCSLRLPGQDFCQMVGICDDEGEEAGGAVDLSPLELQINWDDPIRKFKIFNERVQQLQFFWNQCGFCIDTDDIWSLACAMDRLQTHPSIAHCRFWGVMNGLKASYYIVEACLTREEIDLRKIQMEEEIKKKGAPVFLTKEEQPLPPHIGPELTPGINGWEHWPKDELDTMVPAPPSIPIPDVPTIYDIPPELIGTGLNRFSYFVVNNFQDDWIELPVVTPKQIVTCRWIKKFLVGDLEYPVTAYPCFPGKEKHYLRTLIARITHGSYIAPRGFYRRMTKREKLVWEGLWSDEMELEEEEEEENEFENEEEEYDNDVVLLRSEKFKPKPVSELQSTMNWVHVRPDILNQGRIVWFDEIKAAKEREKEIARLLKLRMMEEMVEEEEEEGEEEEDFEEEGMLDDLNPPELGRPILSPISDDICEFSVAWVARMTSKFTNANERVIVMQSNVWPGSFTFGFENVCESIYMGWGQKYCSRNMPFKHLPQIMEEYPHGLTDFIETTDPTPADEEAYRLAILARMKRDADIGEHMSDYEGSTHESNTDND